MILLRLVYGLILSLCAASNIWALNLSNLHEVQLPVPATLAGRILGTALDISKTTAAVAAYSDDDNIASSVYLYAVQENWRITTELKTESTADDFARRIVLSEHLLIVGASGDDSQGLDSGAIYIYQRDAENNAQQWLQTAKLTAADAQAGDQFGSAIALVDNVLYIGAPFHGRGKVYVYTRHAISASWQLTDSIEPEDPQALRFGAAIAEDQQTLIIGAPYTDANDEEAQTIIRPRFAISKGDTVDPGIESGAIYVYRQVSGQWQATARLGSANRETGDHLGNDIAIEGDIIAGSIRHKDVFDDLRAGVVYVYKNVAGEWQEDSALVASDPNVGANFGSDFILRDKQILVGANKVHANGFNSGQAYLFAQDGNGAWGLIHQQQNAGLKAHDQFGLSVTLGLEFLLVGSNHAVFAFQETPTQYYPAVFYPDNNTLQLNEVLLNDLGVLAVAMDLKQLNDEFILSVSDYHLRTGIENSNITYSSSTGRLTIPQLAIQTNTGEITLYTVELQQIENSASIQFKLLSFNPIQP